LNQTYKGATQRQLNSSNWLVSIKKTLSLCAKLVELNKKIRVGAVSYLNTKPLLYGVKRSKALLEQIELIEEYPAKIAERLIKGTIDVGLVPVAIIPKLREWHIISDFCIGADAEVASVCIFSEVPIENAEKVLLDYQSSTSVNLAKILLKHYWKKNVILEDAREDFREHIMGTTAGVVIGDRALEQRKISSYIYDLSACWKDMTGFPFVFAAWIANRYLPEAFVQTFNRANGIGLMNLEEVIRENPYDTYNLHTYYTKNINYELTEDKRKGLELFLEYLNEMNK
jgi:chorismate dehydratase